MVKEKFYPLLLQWMRSSEIDDSMCWKNAAERQMCFVRDVLCTDLLKVPVFVVSTHTSKSILLPVYRFRLQNGIIVTARENFYLADGMVAGSIASTGDMLRSAFNCIGTAKGIKLASSCFLMDLATPTEAGNEQLIFADCGVNPNPDADALVDIALATIKTHQALIGTQPKVAFLCYSTKGSAAGDLVTKMQTAAEMTKQRVAELGIDALVDGELQADAALVASVGASKAPGSDVAGQANILIFPDLNCGNICYKMTQRFGKAEAYGPILQGIAKPCNDLSRGCSVDDIVATVAITAVQAQ